MVFSDTDYNKTVKEYSGRGRNRFLNYARKAAIGLKDCDVVRYSKELIKERIGGVRSNVYIATLSEDGSQPKSLGQKAKNFVKSPPGLLLIGGLVASGIYTAAAATLGNRPAQGLPKSPSQYGREYDQWAFPLNFKRDGEGPTDVARRVVIGYGVPKQDLILTNLGENLKANAPAYATPTVMGVVGSVGTVIAKKPKKNLGLKC